MKQGLERTRPAAVTDRWFALAGSLILAGTVTVALSLALSGAPVAAASESDGEWHVCPAGPPTCDFATVQEAVDAAGPGDVIKVAEGIYTDIHVREGMTQVVFITESVTIRGGYTTADWGTSDPVAHPATLDAGGQGRVALTKGDYDWQVTVTLDSLWLTNGRAPGTGWGGGIYAEYTHLAITGCQVFSNSSSRRGGGVGAKYSRVAVTGCLVFGNSASDQGGGLDLHFLEETVLGANVIYSNTANVGGGVRIDGSADARFADNAVFGNAALAGSGGGLSVRNCDRLVVWGNQMHDNRAVSGSGGAISLGGGDDGIVGQNRICRNVAESNGGGLYASTDVARLVLIENEFYDNVSEIGNGGGLNLWGVTDAMAMGNRIAQNEAKHGGGLGFDAVGPARLAGNRIYSNTASSYGGAVWMYDTGPFTMVNNVIANNEAGASGSGLFVYGSSSHGSAGRLVHNTLGDNRHGNGGEAIYLEEYTNLTLTNNLIAGHAVGLYAQPGSTNTVSADHTLFFANDVDTDGTTIVSTHAITGQDPRFVDPSAWDYHILGDSAAIDAGIPVAWLTIDVDGDLRPSADGYDIGADEAGPVLTLAKSGPEWANPGAEITYDLLLTNLGALPASGVTVTDALPAGSHFIAASEGGTVSGGTVAWAGLDVAPHGGGLTRTFVVTATETITNCDYRASAEGVRAVAGTLAVSTKRNHAPQADAGPDQTVDPLALVTLDGSGSSDPDGHAMTVRWTQTGGDSVTLNNSSAVSPTFYAPGTLGELTFELLVTDVYGLSDSDTTVVTVFEESYVYLPFVVRQAP